MKIHRKNIFITGIGTGVGKTVVSAILTEALNADYWKPIQAGNLKNSDSKTVFNLISNNVSKVHPEAFKLKYALSPHEAAKKQGLRINIEKMKIPETNNPIIIEGSGGVLVPLNENFLMIDLIKKINESVILVSNNYLGSINHTLLTVESLINHEISILGIIFNGRANKASEDYITNYLKIKKLGSVKLEKVIDRQSISKYSKLFKGIL